MNEYVIALAGNPNVGKSTVFNLLTGLNQHTGNWPGKTVDVAEGSFELGEKKCRLIDLPGTYSLISNSEDEELARDFICFGDSDLVLMVADATALERNLNLVLQTAETAGNAVLCINLMDEAKKHGIKINAKKLENILGIPVVTMSARNKNGIDLLKEAVNKQLSLSRKNRITVKYPKEVEYAVHIIEAELSDCKKLSKRWTALKLLEGNPDITSQIAQITDISSLKIKSAVSAAHEYLKQHGTDPNSLTDIYASASVKAAEKISHAASESTHKRKLGIDKILTSKYAGLPLMMLMLGFVFWLTVTGANYPSEFLGKVLFGFEKYLWRITAPLPSKLADLLITGMYHTLSWVVSVMLPPMAIFFPLFAVLEDLGYLPRIAFNLDKCFKGSGAHGRQSLTMCQGFGCNACGVMGCRIINSPRERLIAVLTNNFVPCNGRFPTLIVLISLFFASSGIGTSFVMLLVISFSVIMTLAASKFLSSTLLKGMPSSFAMELPPLRKPQFAKVIVRSFLDKTLLVLFRAVIVALPAGAVIWFLASFRIGGISLLQSFCDFLDPFGRLVGMDGCILAAFILGFPANEIVIPIMIMNYTQAGKMTDPENTAALGELLRSNGWTSVTALCVIIFCLMHFPCATTCQTIYKETKSKKWTAVSVLLPTVTGLILCFLISTAAKLLGF